MSRAIVKAHPTSLADLVDAIGRASSPAVGGVPGVPLVAFQMGTVVSLQPATWSLTITLGGSAVPIAGVQYTTAYPFPRVGDTVLVDHVGKQLVVVGAVVGGGGIFPQYGITAVTTNPSGVFSITLPTAFPNALLDVQLTQSALASSGGGTAIWNQASSTRLVISGWIFGLVSGTATVSWLALGR